MDCAGEDARDAVEMVAVGAATEGSSHFGSSQTTSSFKGLPGDNSFIRSKMSAPEQARMDFDSIDESKVIVHHACCCCYDGCVPEVHHIGCAAQKTVLCLECDLCCKTGAPCLCCGCCAFRCVDLTTCCKAQGQFFCCVTGSAFPPDDEVPCMLNVCFLNCFPRLGCCMRLGDMKAKQMPWESEATTTSD